MDFSYRMISLKEIQMENSLEVKLFADLRNMYHGNGYISLSQAESIEDILERLGIPEKKVSIILVNGKHAVLGDSVSPGDRLALFPPIGGG